MSRPLRETTFSVCQLQV